MYPNCFKLLLGGSNGVDQGGYDGDQGGYELSVSGGMFSDSVLSQLLVGLGNQTQRTLENSESTNPDQTPTRKTSLKI